MLAPFGLSFSVAGLLFPYHIGVIDRLTSASILTPSTPINGASGGALAAACAAANFPSSKSLAASLNVANACNERGAFLNLEKILRDELDQLCTDEMVQTLNNRPAHFQVLWTQLNFPSLKPIRTSHFSSRQSLIDSLTASSHIPLYSSLSPFTTVDSSKLGVDGFLSTPSTLGCQQVEGASTSIFITPFAVMGGPSGSVIAPTAGQVPFDPQLYVKLALGRPGPDELQHNVLFDLGYDCAERWLEAYKNTN